APNRFSLAWNYNLPDVNNDRGVLGRVGSGWVISGTSVIQSGNPINVFTNAPFEPVTNNGQYVGYTATSGDYNADGDNFDFPDVANYSQGTSRRSYLNGIFSSGQFAQPAFGQEGNERYNRFVGPNFNEWDTALLKNTKIAESVNFQFRLEVFNTFNRPNLINVNTNLSNGNFGKATGQNTPRFIQLGGNLTF
ncbi:MAG TPA: hypothetical protein VFL96_05760, partial [Acidobacteriaceae bacterium]|nr:hypothetical protein [Acidobacteriaceae bacterium]